MQGKGLDFCCTYFGTRKEIYYTHDKDVRGNNMSKDICEMLVFVGGFAVVLLFFILIPWGIA